MNTIRILIRWTIHPYRRNVSGLPNFYGRNLRRLEHTAPARPITFSLVIHAYTNTSILATGDSFQLPRAKSILQNSIIHFAIIL